MSGYFKDRNGNKWSKDSYTFKESQFASSSLIDCENCIDCDHCTDCINCVNCDDCDDCYNSTNLTSCAGCRGRSNDTYRREDCDYRNGIIPGQ